MTTTGKELSQLANQFFNDDFRGVFASNELPNNINCAHRQTLIINTDTNNLPGTHWVALIIYPRASYAEYFDSFGQPPPNHIKYWLSRHIPNRIWYNPYHVQPIYSILCGYYCIYFLFHRISISLLPNDFIKRHFEIFILSENDRSVKNFISCIK